MLKKIVASLMVAVAGMSLASCAGGNDATTTTTVAPTTQTESGLPKKGSVTQTGLKVNPKSVVGYVGDPMPFYDDGEMNVFYLQDGRNTNLGFHPFALMTTTDYVHYND